MSIDSYTKVGRDKGALQNKKPPTHDMLTRVSNGSVQMAENKSWKTGTAGTRSRLLVLRNN